MNSSILLLKWLLITSIALVTAVESMLIIIGWMAVIISMHAAVTACACWAALGSADSDSVVELPVTAFVDDDLVDRFSL